MSQFVNYNKRSVTLPPGCKNLIDVLQNQELLAPGEAGCLLAAVARGGMVKGTLSEFGKYVKRAFRSRGPTYMLTVSPPDQRITFHLAKTQNTPMWASVLVREGSTEEAAVRAFYTKRSLKLPESSPSTMPFYPKLPVQTICRILPMPPSADALSTLATELFREVCGLNEGSELYFHHHETANAT